MTKILCTGSAGFIFSNFVRKALYERKDWKIVSIDKLINPSGRDNLYISKNHTFHIGDISDAHFIDNVFRLERPDIVLNGAAYTHVDDSIKEPNRFILSNVLGTQVLANASIKYGVEKFVMVSTDEVMGHLTNENDPLLTEEAPLNPRNPYAASKASAELIIKAMGITHGLKYCITRSSNNYGPRQTSDKFIPKVIKCILNNQPIPVYGEGKQIRDWLQVWDNCAAIMKIVDIGIPGETYNISANQEFSNIEVVNMICNILGKGHDLITFVKDRLAHDFRYGINSSKIRALGWAPEFKFKAGLAKTIDWYKLNKPLIDKQDASIHQNDNQNNSN
jgi:dTDP-glucose 4,6-dehydratase